MEKRIVKNPTFKIMYHPKTLQIMGKTDGDVSMFLPNGKPYPYIETKKFYNEMTNLAIEVKDGKASIKILKGTL